MKQTNIHPVKHNKRDLKIGKYSNTESIVGLKFDFDHNNSP